MPQDFQVWSKSMHVDVKCGGTLTKSGGPARSWGMICLELQGKSYSTKTIGFYDAAHCFHVKNVKKCHMFVYSGHALSYT